MENGKYAVIDIGSNSIRMNAYEVNNNKLNSYFTQKAFASLSSYVENGNLSEKGINKAIKTLKKMNKTAQDLKIEHLYPFATASIRNVNNSDEVIKRIKKETSLSIDLLSGEDEAYCDFIGVTSKYNLKNGGIIDIGGGSTEIISVSNGEIREYLSLTHGGLSMYSQYVKKVIANQKEIALVRKDIKAKLKAQKIKKISSEDVYCVGGLGRACGNIAYEYFKLESNQRFEKKHLAELIEKLSKKDEEVIKITLQVSPQRIHTQLPGMVILKEFMDYFKIDMINVSKRGVREGYLIQKIGGER